MKYNKVPHNLIQEEITMFTYMLETANDELRCSINFSSAEEALAHSAPITAALGAANFRGIHVTVYSVNAENQLTRL
jgi:hypothetical protein